MFWPDMNSLFNIVKRLIDDNDISVHELSPESIHLIPRTDNSIFLINTSHRTCEVKVKHAFRDRLSGKSLTGTYTIEPFAVHWLEKIKNP